MTTVAEGLYGVAGRLAERGVEAAEREARELVAHAAAVSRDTLPTRLPEPLSPQAATALDLFVSRRLSGVPLAYLLGEWDFTDFTLTVTPDVLIPRPETEELFALAARVLGDAPGTLVDVGTGSGAIALAAARRWPSARPLGLELSVPALAVARWNARRLGLEARVDFRRSDLLEAVLSGGETVDAVVSNPPYVSRAEWPALPAEVRREPRLALDGGGDGLDVIRRLVPQAARALRPGGRLFLEIGRGQAPAVVALAEAAGFAGVRAERDFAGIDRFVWGTRP